MATVLHTNSVSPRSLRIAVSHCNHSTCFYKNVWRDRNIRNVLNIKKHFEGPFEIGTLGIKKTNTQSIQKKSGQKCHFSVFLKIPLFVPCTSMGTFEWKVKARRSMPSLFTKKSPYYYCMVRKGDFSGNWISGTFGRFFCVCFGCKSRGPNLNFDGL